MPMRLTPFARFDSHVEPVAARRLVAEKQRGQLGPPARQEEIEAAVVVEVAARAGRGVNDLFLLHHLRHELA